MKFRYAIATQGKALARKLNVQINFDYHPVYNACPDQVLPVLANNDRFEVKQFSWGMMLHPASKKFYDIAVENIFQHWKVPRKLRIPLLKMIREQRCIVLANCFVVWQDNLVPYCVYSPEHRLLGLAGLWNRINKDDCDSFSVLTQPANRFMKRLNQERMPLIINENQYQRWLKGPLSYSYITQMLREVFPSSDLNAYPISNAIQDTGMNTAKILKPVGQRIKDESDLLLKDKLVPLGWGRSRPEKESDPLWKQLGLDQEEN